MAKKKTIDLRSVEPTPVPTGDVNIVYNGTRIAGFSEDTDATLKTGGTRVLHDIEMNYTKPSGGLHYVPLTLTITATEGSYFLPSQHEMSQKFCVADSAGNLISCEYLNDANAIIPDYDSERHNYLAGFAITPNPAADSLTVTANGEPVAYSSDTEAYWAIITSETYPENLTITIADKQV